MKQQNEFHASDMRYTKLQMQSAINDKQRTIDKILNWFPIVGEYIRIEKDCFEHGFNEEQTNKLVHGQILNFRGYLMADRRSPRVWAESETVKIVRIAKDKLQLTVEQSPIVQWLRMQSEHKENSRTLEEEKKSTGCLFHL